MTKALFFLAPVAAAIAAPAAAAQDYRFDFSGTVLAALSPASVTPQDITGYLTYVDNVAPADGNVVTTNGSATLFTNLFDPVSFTGYTAVLTNRTFTFGGLNTDGSTFSLSLSALPDGSFGVVKRRDGFSLTTPTEQAVGQVSGMFDTPTTSVPEPAAWLLMIVGMGAVGVALRRERIGKVRYI